MAYILHLETATDVCSVALSHHGQLVHEVQAAEPRSHISKLSVLIDDMLKRQQIAYSVLDAVAVSAGPGSYTGLRVAYATAKGLCFALQKPMIEVDTLQSIAHAMAQSHTGASCYMPMIDARRMEVYTNQFDQANLALSQTEAVVLTPEFFESMKQAYDTIVIGGNGAFKTRNFVEASDTQVILSEIVCDARHLVSIAYEKYEAEQFADVAYCEPRYLKPPNITVSKKKLF